MKTSVLLITLSAFLASAATAEARFGWVDDALRGASKGLSKLGGGTSKAGDKVVHASVLGTLFALLTKCAGIAATCFSRYHASQHRDAESRGFAKIGIFAGLIWTSVAWFGWPVGVVDSSPVIWIYAAVGWTVAMFVGLLIAGSIESANAEGNPSGVDSQLVVDTGSTPAG